MIFILFSISSVLEFLSVNYTSIYGNSKLKVFEKIKFWGETSSNNWPNDLLQTRLLNLADNRC